MPPRVLRLNPPIPALHPERDALLAAVRDAHPADDLPALVYADWQDEHGQPEHAELIRVMVELAKARKQDAASKARRPKLLARMKELFKTPPLKPLRNLETDTWKFERGFVRNLTFYIINEERSPAIRARVVVRAAELADLPTRVPFDKLAWLGVMLPERPTAAHVAALAAAPWLKRLDRIEMYRWGSDAIRSGMLAPLIASRNLGGLRCFEPHGPIAAGELVGLYLAKSAKNLREFPLDSALRFVTADEIGDMRSGRKIRHAAIERIVSSPRAKQFTSLGDAITDVDEPLAKILLASPHLKRVRDFRYTFKKVTKRTQTAFTERFGEPERID